ncbi:MAG: hypothetical protein ACYCWW_17405 [Deltaproteobacteria bacterium]
MSLRWRGGLLAIFGLSLLGGAQAGAATELQLELPELTLKTIPAAMPPAIEPDAPSWAQAGWLAFGADLAFELGVSATELAFGGYGAALALLGGTGPAIGALFGLGLVLVLHPLIDSLIVDLVGRASPTHRTDITLTLMGAYAGCLLGTLGFVVAVLALQSSVLVGLLVGGILNSDVPPAETVAPQQLFARPAPAASNEPALRAAETQPLLAWSL